MIKVVALPDKPSVVALIDVDKVLGKSLFCSSQVFLIQGNLMDILQQKFLKSIPFWDGTCSKDGRYGLYAPATGGMEMLDLRTGKVCRTLIPKVKSRHYAVLLGLAFNRWRKESLMCLPSSMRQMSSSFTTTGFALRLKTFESNVISAVERRSERLDGRMGS